MDMIDTDKILAEKLQSIPYDGEYLNLCFTWLTYRKIKPVSVIDFSKDSQSSEQLIQWCKEAGVSHQKDSSGKDLLYISKDKEKMEIMQKIFMIKSPILEIIKCEYFGFPPESAYAYISQMFTLPESKKNIRASKTSEIEKNFTEYWKPYISYMMRLGLEREDSLVAKLWFDTCSQEIPEIHKIFLDQYETDKLKNAEKQRELISSLEGFQSISKEDKEKLKEVFLRNLDSGWVRVTAEEKAAITDWLKKARISSDEDVSDEYQIYFTTVLENIEAFQELNSFQGAEAKRLRQKYF